MHGALRSSRCPSFLAASALGKGVIIIQSISVLVLRHAVSVHTATPPGPARRRPLSVRTRPGDGCSVISVQYRPLENSSAHAANNGEPKVAGSLPESRFDGSSSHRKRRFRYLERFSEPSGVCSCRHGADQVLFAVLLQSP